MHDWYSPEGFEFGEMYVDSEGELTLEYAGSVTARAAQGLITASADTIETSHDTELVLVFLVVDDDDDAVTFYTHTKADADRGYGFISLADRPVDRFSGRRSRPK